MYFREKDGKLRRTAGAAPVPASHLLSKATLESLAPFVTGKKLKRGEITPRTTTSMASSRSHQYCACTGSAEDPCADLTPESDMVYPPENIKPAWYAKVIRGGSADRRRSNAAAERKPVHKKHFGSCGHTEKTSQFGKKRPVATGSAVPVLPESIKEAPPPPPPPVSRMGELYLREKLRKGLPENFALHDAITDLIQAQVAAELEGAVHGALGGVGEGAAESAPPHPPVLDIWATLKIDEWCHWHTNYETWDILVATFEHLDADGAFSGMTHYAFGKADHEVESGKDRPTALTTFQQFVIFSVVFKRFRGNGLIKHAPRMFGIHERTGQRYYVDWALAGGRFYNGQQHPATRSQAFAPTAAKTRGRLRLGGNGAIFMRGCTERWVNNPGRGELHSALYSSYKSHTTIKYLTISTGDSYLCRIPRPFCADNGAHDLAAAHKLLMVQK